MGITDEAHRQLLNSTEKEQNAMSLSWNSIVSRVFTQVVFIKTTADKDFVILLYKR